MGKDKMKEALEILSPEQINQIHNTAIRILSEIGMKINHQEILSLLRGTEAEVDVKSGIVKMNEYLVMDSVEKTTKKYILYGRDRGKQARFGYGHFNCLSSGGMSAWVDLAKNERRAPTLKDATCGIRIGDALPEIDIVGAFAVPKDVPPEVKDIHLFAELMKNTTKPVCVFFNNGKTTRYVLEMCKIVRGEERELKDQPILDLLASPISPLQYSKEVMENLIEFSKLGLPVGFAPMVMPMATGPSTLAGSIAQCNAEILAGVVISQLLSPGMPVLYVGIPHIIDPATANISFGSPEQGLMAAITTQIGKSYGFPVGTNVGLTDAKCADAQNGMEKATTLLLAALAGTDLSGHMGICGPDEGASLCQLIIDNEVISYVRRILRGLQVSNETLAFDVIKRVGIGGDFFTDQHTLRHFRNEIWFPELLDRGGWELWSERGRKSLLDKAVERRKRLLRDHKVEPLNEDISQELDRIVKAADKDILG